MPLTARLYDGAAPREQLWNVPSSSSTAESKRSRASFSTKPAPTERRGLGSQHGARSQGGESKSTASARREIQKRFPREITCRQLRGLHVDGHISLINQELHLLRSSKESEQTGIKAERKETVLVHRLKERLVGVNPCPTATVTGGKASRR